jgi:chromosome segregation ATPase
MDDALNKKIQDLAKEAQSLSNIKISLQKQLRDIDTRLVQLTGAIVELKKLQTELQGDKNDKAEDSPIGEHGVHTSLHQADEHNPPDEDGIQTKEDGV